MIDPVYVLKQVRGLWEWYAVHRDYVRTFDPVDPTIPPDWIYCGYAKTHEAAMEYGRARGFCD